MKKIVLAAATLAAMMSGAYAVEDDPTDGVILPRHTTAAGVPVYTDGEIQPAVGVCCSDGVAQVSSVTIAAATPPAAIPDTPGWGSISNEDDDDEPAGSGSWGGGFGGIGAEGFDSFDH